MAPLTSTRNPRVRAWAALSRSRDRRQSGQHLAEGPTIVALAAAAGLVEEVITTDPSFAPDGHTPVTVVSEQVLRHVCDAVTPQPVAAVVRTPVVELAAVVGEGLLVVLDQLADPGNVGTLIRTAHAFGARAVVAAVPGADPFSPKAVRASAGSVYAIDVVHGVGLDEVLVACRGVDQPTVGLDASARAPVETLAELGLPLALILGSESHGITGAAALDRVVAVPMPGGGESLNVAAAGAIALYIAARMAPATRTSPPEVADATD